jgi:hypothetical protein
VIFSIIAIWHFGITPAISIIFIIASSFVFAVKVLKIKDYLLATIAGLFCYVQIFTLIALLSNVDIAYYSTFIIFCLPSLLIKPKEPIKFTDFLSGFTVIDWTLIFTVFIFGSLPQLHWDAVQANLYIAKWYVLSNSLSPIKESITSLFPQSAIVYYSLFYKIGGLKMLQVAFFLPFLLTLMLIKQICRRINLGLLGQIFLYQPLLLPFSFPSIKRLLRQLSAPPNHFGRVFNFLLTAKKYLP